MCVFLCVCAVEIGPASVMVGTLVSGKRIAQASGRDLGQTDDNDQVRHTPSAQSTVICPESQL